MNARTDATGPRGWDDRHYTTIWSREARGLSRFTAPAKATPRHAQEVVVMGDCSAELVMIPKRSDECTTKRSAFLGRAQKPARRFAD